MDLDSRAIAEFGTLKSSSKNAHGCGCRRVPVSLLRSLVRAGLLGYRLRSSGAQLPAAEPLELEPQVSWEPMVRDRIARLAESSPPGVPVLVGIVGVPGAGKTTCTGTLAAMIPGSVRMPADGYHIPLARLRRMPGAADLIYRRGAPDTFDAAALKQDLHQIKSGGQATVALPGFEHERGDPAPGMYIFDRSAHRVVLVEGLYLLQRQGEWDGVAAMLDLTVFIEADVNECISRLKRRNQCIPGYDPEEIARRCDIVDRANAELVAKDRDLADIVVPGLASHKMIGLDSRWSYTWRLRSTRAVLSGPSQLEPARPPPPPRRHFSRPYYPPVIRPNW